jgi:tRNA threonylcarbamoyladenosine biosynthesis protein TsaE
MNFHISDPDAMENLGGILARACPFGVQINLKGELGTGKTTLVRGFLNALGYSGIVKSPTYTLVEPYSLPQGSIYHFDLYRLHTPDELEAIGVRDYLDGDSTCLVEWPEKAGHIFSSPDLHTNIIHADTARIVVLTAMTDLGKEIMGAIPPA